MQLFQPEADIYLNCLKQNYHVIQTIVGDAKVMAVIKANAYGHGIIPVAKTLSNVGIHGFCVALESEAEELIKTGIRTPILHFGRISKDSFELYNCPCSEKLKCADGQRLSEIFYDQLKCENIEHPDLHKVRSLIVLKIFQ